MSDPTLFGSDEEFHTIWQEWEGMPEFVQEDLMPFASIIVNFATAEDMRAFAALVEQTVPMSGPNKTMSIWYPKAELGSFGHLRYRGRP